VLIIELAGEVCLLVHLRMSGRLYPLATEEPLPDHVRAIFHLNDGRRLLFVNPRRLGRLEIADCDRLDEGRLLRNMGIDALSDELNEQVVGEMLGPHSIALKQWLLDQSHIAGIGNIYASEILHRVRLHPDTLANSLERAERGDKVAGHDRLRLCYWPRRTGGVPEAAAGVRTGGEGLPPSRLLGNNCPHHPRRPQHLFLPSMSAAAWQVTLINSVAQASRLCGSGFSKRCRHGLNAHHDSGKKRPRSERSPRVLV